MSINLKQGEYEVGLITHVVQIPSYSEVKNIQIIQSKRNPGMTVIEVEYKEPKRPRYARGRRPSDFYLHNWKRKEVKKDEIWPHLKKKGREKFVRKII